MDNRALSDVIWVEGFGPLANAVSQGLPDFELRLQVRGCFTSNYRLSVRNGQCRTVEELAPDEPVDVEFNWELTLQDLRDVLCGRDILDEAIDSGAITWFGSALGRRAVSKLLVAVRELDFSPLVRRPAQNLMPGALRRLREIESPAAQVS